MISQARETYIRKLIEDVTGLAIETLFFFVCKWPLVVSLAMSFCPICARGKVDFASNIVNELGERLRILLFCLWPVVEWSLRSCHMMQAVFGGMQETGNQVNSSLPDGVLLRVWRIYRTMR